eukprot:SAG11_NODE_1440_length_4905_cov_6.216188_6_plen_99_part_00
MWHCYTQGLHVIRQSFYADLQFYSPEADGTGSNARLLQHIRLCNAHVGRVHLNAGTGQAESGSSARHQPPLAPWPTCRCMQVLLLIHTKDTEDIEAVR